MKNYNTYNAYKDSGEQWMGKIPEHWEISRLGTLLNDVSIRNNSDMPLLSITREEGVIIRDIEDDTTNHNFIPDDLSNYKLIEKGQFGMNKMKAWQGSYGIAPVTGIVSPAYYIFKFMKEIDSDFFHLAIRSRLYVSFFGQASDGVRIGQWDLNRERMNKIPFVIPPLPEQEAIANFLDDKTSKIDQAITQKEALIDLLKERKQIIIQDLVTGKKVWNEEKQVWEKPTKVKDSGIEWIGDIPEDWEVKRLKYVLNLTNNKVLSFNSNLTYIGMENIESKSGKYIETDSEVEGMANCFNKGNILFGKLRPYLAKVYSAEFDGICSTEFLVYESSNTDYFSKLLLSDSFIQVVNASTYGAKMPRASTDFIENTFLPIPSSNEQNQIVSHIESQTSKIDKAISIMEEEIERLKELKAVLIDSAVTGKIRVG